MRLLLHRGLKVLIVTIFLLTSIALFSTTVASTFSWTNNEDPVFSIDQDQTKEPKPQNDCVVAKTLLAGDSESRDMCVTYGSSFNYGIYHKVTYDRSGTASHDYKFAFNTKNELKMYKVTNFSVNQPITVPNSNDIVQKISCAGYPWGGNLIIAKNFLSHLTPYVDPSTLTTSYTYDYSSVYV